MKRNKYIREAKRNALEWLAVEEKARIEGRELSAYEKKGIELAYHFKERLLDKTKPLVEIRCAVCPTTFGSRKELLAHFKENHQEKLAKSRNRRIKNK